MQLSAKRNYLVHRRPEDVAETLAGGGSALDPATVDARLTQLVQWGNLRRDLDTGRVTTVEDFYRPRYLYQLTAEGEAAELALDAYDRALGRRGELQSIALEDISVRLRSLGQEIEGGSGDPAVGHALLRDLTGLLDSLASNASQFMASLQRTIDLQDVDEDAFIAYKDRLIDYLSRFVGDLAVKSAEIAAGLRSLPEAPLDALLAAVAAREAADAAPDPDVQADAARMRLGEWHERWAGLRSWFVGDRHHPSQAQLLRGRARGAIPELLAAVTVLQDRRSGRSDRSADYRTLALWFARATSDREAHRLWRAAFGLASSRHLAIDAEMLDALEAEPVAPTTRWQDAPPVAIAPRLRQTGRYQRRGMPSRIVDRSPARELLARRLGAERLEIESARQRLATGLPIRLSDLGCLDEREFPLFLTLLGDALGAGPPPPGGTRTTSGDGSIEIHLVPAGDGSRFELQTPGGQFSGPDHLVTFVDLLPDLLPMAVGEGP